MACVLVSFGVVVACNSIDGANNYQNVDGLDGSNGGDAKWDGQQQNCGNQCLETNNTCQSTCYSQRQDCLSNCQQGGCNKCDTTYQTCSDQCTTACTNCNCTQQQCNWQPPQQKDAGGNDGSSFDASFDAQSDGG